jgi:hypothetical protein
VSGDINSIHNCVTPVGNDVIYSFGWVIICSIMEGEQNFVNVESELPTVFGGSSGAVGWESGPIRQGAQINGNREGEPRLRSYIN